MHSPDMKREKVDFGNGLTCEYVAMLNQDGTVGLCACEGFVREGQTISIYQLSSEEIEMCRQLMDAKQARAANRLN